MEIYIAGDIDSIESVTFSEKGFGKNLDESLYDCELVVDSNEFLNKFEWIYNDCIDELVRDDKITGKFHPPYEGAENYPSISELFSIPEPQRMEMISAYFIFDILRCYVNEDSTDFKWVIKNIASVHQDDENIVIKGKVAPKNSWPN